MPRVVQLLAQVVEEVVLAVHTLEGAVAGNSPQHVDLPVGILGEFLIRAAGQHSQLFAQVDVPAAQVAGGRRQVVRGHGGQAGATVCLRSLGPICVTLKPHDRGAHHATAGQVVLHPRLEGAQILADHDSTGAVSFQYQRADQSLVVVGDVRAERRRFHPRDPPQAEKPQHVVDADATGGAQDRAQHVAPRTVALFGQLPRVPRGLGPVLTLLVVAVRWGANASSRRQHVGQGLGVRAAGVYADGQIRHEADAHVLGQRLLRV